MPGILTYLYPTFEENHCRNGSKGVCSWPFNESGVDGSSVSH